MNQFKVGTTSTYKVDRIIDHGYVLTDGVEEVMLHINDAEEQLEVGQQVQAFLYHDKQGKIVATTYIPEIDFVRYGWVEVVDIVDDLGVFVNIGIPKHVLVSKDDLPLFRELWPYVHDQLYVCLQRDKRDRLLAKPATEDVMQQYAEPAPESLLHAPISGTVYRTNKVGSFLVTEEGYQGFIHHTERKEEPRLGQWVKGRVIDVKTVGSLNISLRPQKEEALSEDAEHIMEYLTSHDGIMFYTDKSDPEAIREQFNISKAAFKRALGTLMKQKKVKQEDGKTLLIKA
ncbi:hypothetical protein N784_11620 [Pontibacillus litoralis JSM 072002]|uniref:S1 motif domain-containing protein n=2 Tax=Pontibacillus TaxID=289201 RepID=A0A0A5FYN0_9BACI|nr:hypothetical protein N784_11620 [Pontibacillus litoralis JSM 072002]